MKTKPVCDIAMQALLEGSWVVWEHPDDDDRRTWVGVSSDARRGLVPLGEQVEEQAG